LGEIISSPLGHPQGYALLGERGQDKDQGFLMVLVTPVETIV